MVILPPEDLNNWRGLLDVQVQSSTLSSDVLQHPQEQGKRDE